MPPFTVPPPPRPRRRPAGRPVRAARLLAAAGPVLAGLGGATAGADDPVAEATPPVEAAAPDVALNPRLPGPLETVSLVMRLLEEDRPAAASWFLAAVPGATDADRTASAAMLGEVIERTGRRLVPVRAFVEDDAAVVLAWEGDRGTSFAAMLRRGDSPTLATLPVVHRDGAWRMIPPRLAVTPQVLGLPAGTIARMARLLDVAEAAEAETLEAARALAVAAAADPPAATDESQEGDASDAPDEPDEPDEPDTPSIAALAPDAAAMEELLGPGWEPAPGVLVEDASRPIGEQGPGVTPTLLEVLRTTRVQAAADLSWARTGGGPGLVTARLFRFEDEAAAAAWWARQAGGLEPIEPPADPGADLPHAARSTPDGRILAGRIGPWTLSVRSVGADVHRAVFAALWPRIAARAAAGDRASEPAAGRGVEGAEGRDGGNDVAADG